MKFSSALISILISSLALVNAIPTPHGNQSHKLLARADDPPTLVPGNVDGNNFKPFPQSDFCKKSGQAESDGSQNKAGACSSTPMGQIPSVDKMVSTLIINPDSGAKVDASKDNTVTIAISNLATGFFDDPQKQYYLFPQTLNGQGIIQGHQHITVQKMNGKAVLDAKVFAFFKGLNAASPDGKTLSVTIPAGTLRENGQHRICSLSGTFSHQPVVMPVAQRGAQDDCIRVDVFNAGKVPPPPAAAAAKATTTNAAAQASATPANNNNNNNNNGGNKGRNKFGFGKNNGGQQNGGQQNGVQQNGGQQNAAQQGVGLPAGCKFTSNGGLAVGDPTAIKNQCNALNGQKADPGKLSACLGKINNGDCNPAGPKITFGFGDNVPTIGTFKNGVFTKA
ncbi:hypothetical protein HK098_000697 [Nowakowskiella sp. JEL0407]|nr:hypothetical protein HK098_000697 [Nowakowskiella sp. JEL0407]